MAYVGIEFPQADGGGIALVHKKWLTPRKKEVWWPPFKQQDHFNKSLKKGASPDENWKIYGVIRSFFEEEDFAKASKKIKQLEYSSDIQSEHEELPVKRRIKRKALFTDTSSSDSDTPLKKPIPGLDKLLKKKASLSGQTHFEEKDFSQETQSSLEFSVQESRGATQRNVDISVHEPVPATQSDRSLEFSVEESHLATQSFLDLPMQDCRPKSQRFQDFSLPEYTPTRQTSLNLSLQHCRPPSQRCQDFSLQEPRPATHRRVEGLHENLVTSVSNDLGKTLLAYLVMIKNQSSEILARLKEKEVSSSAGVILNFPVELPIKSIEDVGIVEEYLNEEGKISTLAAHCASFGGKDLTNKVNIILRNLISNKVAVNYNFCGSRGGKSAFGKLKLKSVVVEAIQLKSPATSVHQIENQIKIWLKHAPKRVGLENRQKT